MDFPIRLNHYLALKQYCSRRMADRLIAEGKVKINGKLARLGQKINATDQVEVDLPTVKKIASARVYLAYHKPKGVDTHSIKISRFGDLFPIGRLDKLSRGLLILTNDGRVTDLLLNPKYEHEKEYEVTVDKKLRPGFLEHLRAGVQIANFTTRPATVKKLSDHKFLIILTEGRHHQIRRMCDAFGYTIRDLKRIRIGQIKLSSLQAKQYRQINLADLANL